jgi:hypothetical protein
VAVKYPLNSDPMAGSRLRAQAEREGRQAGMYAPELASDYDTLRRDAVAVFARHCGDAESGNSGGEMFRWREGGEYVDDWPHGSRVFVPAYLDGYLNACLDRVPAGTPLIGIPFTVAGAKGALRKSSRGYTVIVHHGPAQEPRTTRGGTAVEAADAMDAFLAQTAGTCVAYTESGTLCRQPASIRDESLGGLVCAEHARRVVR